MNCDARPLVFEAIGIVLVSIYEHFILYFFLPQRETKFSYRTTFRRAKFYSVNPFKIQYTISFTATIISTRFSLSLLLSVVKSACITNSMSLHGDNASAKLSIDKTFFQFVDCQKNFAKNPKYRTIVPQTRKHTRHLTILLEETYTGHLYCEHNGSWSIFDFLLSWIFRYPERGCGKSYLLPRYSSDLNFCRVT